LAIATPRGHVGIVVQSQFQSLFCWIGYCNFFQAFGCYIFYFVSILVLLDWLLQLMKVIGHSEDAVVFQSLFCWIGYCNLVLSRRRSAGESGFNPCFVGLAIATVKRVVGLEDRYKFQSLFCWIGYCNMEGVYVVRMRYKFQSLFCWIGYCNWKLSMNSLRLIRVSILVLLDWLLQPDVQTPTTKKTNRVSILVLLDWLLQQNSDSQRLLQDKVSILVLLDWLLQLKDGHLYLQKKIRFNPCFVGLAIATLYKKIEFLVEYPFQSLFCWIGYCNESGENW